MILPQLLADPHHLPIYPTKCSLSLKNIKRKEISTTSKIKNIKTHAHKTNKNHGVCFVGQLLLGMRPVLSVADKSCDTPSEKTDFPFAISDQLQTASWLGVDLCSRIFYINKLS